MHDAFKVSVALDNLPKIDTIFAHGNFTTHYYITWKAHSFLIHRVLSPLGNKLLVGSAGSLMVYQVKDPTGMFLFRHGLYRSPLLTRDWTTFALLCRRRSVRGYPNRDTQDFLKAFH